MAEADGKTPTRIVHVTEAPLGGVVSYLEELVAAQIEGMPDTQIDLITPEINLPALEQLHGPNFRIIGFPMKRGSARDLYGLARRTIRHLRERRPEILHIHSTFAGAAIRGMSPLIPRGTKVVYCPHGWAFSRQGSRKMQRGTALVERALSLVTDRIVCISEYERQAALDIGIADKRLTVIDNGISPRDILHEPTPPQPGAPRMIAFAGRFDRQKGFDTFVEVMRQLGDEARGVAVGSAIVSSDEMPDLPGNIELLGWQPRDEVFALYRRADLLLMPSRWEGFGLVAVEAMQAGLPVFASRVGGLQDIVLDRETGRLFTPDRPDEIVRMIRETSDQDLTEYGRHGLERYRAHYTAERMAKEMAGLYRELLSQ
ncbi:glycosyltransferase family 4 protein [Paracoccus aurantiacus]|uniref:Glycosyltransferase family 4 protein n=1 Tax=Paracoccus aurantiacus TaxID=2599412 RepID=A0A5C6RZ89_9RHOB|nr:glycosyltransferase family 4 protein [Paracoccus aurantiacus]TXB67718.1 glycosyltransferase family 4 protein [Paracoccus aurantiacus]